MVELVNESNYTVVCKVKDVLYNIHCGESIYINEMDMFEISRVTGSYFSRWAEQHKVLKIMSYFSDPFKLLKDFHVVIDSVYQLNEEYANQQIIIKYVINEIDVDTHTYYDYFVLYCQNQFLIPQNSYTRDADMFFHIFKKNNKKLVLWDAAWNIVIEPIVLESIGLFLIFLLFYLWFGKIAAFIVAGIVIFTVLIDTIIFLITNKSRKNIKNFQDYLKPDSINQYLLKGMQVKI